MYHLHYYCEARESSMLRSRAITHIAHTHMHKYALTSASEGKENEREREELTVSWNDPQRHRVSSLFDQVDDIRVGLIGDGAAVYSQDPVSNF